MRIGAVRTIPTDAFATSWDSKGDLDQRTSHAAISIGVIAPLMKETASDIE